MHGIHRQQSLCATALLKQQCICIWSA